MAAIACEGCGAVVDDSWSVCPACGADPRIGAGEAATDTSICELTSPSVDEVVSPSVCEEEPSAHETREDWSASPSGLRALARALRNGTETQRLEAARRLAAVASPYAIAVLAAHLDDRSSTTVSRAVGGLLATCGADGVRALLELTHDAGARSYAVEALRTVDDPEVRRRLAELDEARERGLAEADKAGKSGVGSGVVGAPALTTKGGRRCRSCGAELRAGAQSCGECGTRVPERKPAESPMARPKAREETPEPARRLRVKPKTSDTRPVCPACGQGAMTNCDMVLTCPFCGHQIRPKGSWLDDVSSLLDWPP